MYLYIYIIVIVELIPNLVLVYLLHLFSQNNFDSTMVFNTCTTRNVYDLKALPHIDVQLLCSLNQISTVQDFAVVSSIDICID